jgi:chitinase
MNNWRAQNPNIKIVASIGGYTEGSSNFNSIVSTAENSKTLCQSAIDNSRKYNLDGLDIDWYLFNK